MAEGGFGPDFQIFEIDHDASLPFTAAKGRSKNEARRDRIATGSAKLGFG
jgi:hypothetical protein